MTFNLLEYRAVINNIELEILELLDVWLECSARDLCLMVNSCRTFKLEVYHLNPILNRLEQKNLIRARTERDVSHGKRGGTIKYYSKVSGDSHQTYEYNLPR